MPTRRKGLFPIPVLAFACAALSLTAVMAQDAGVDLRPIWKAGSVSRYRITQTEVTIAALEGLDRQRRSTIEIQAVAVWETLEAREGGGGRARVSIESMSFKITDEEGQTRTVLADSTGEADARIARYIAALTSGPIVVGVTAEGQIDTIEGDEAIRASAGEAGENMDTRFFRNLSSDLAVLTGGRAGAAPGSTWKHESESGHPLGTVRHRYTDELRGVESLGGIPVAAIRRTGELELVADTGDRPPDAPPLDIRATEAASTALLYFDLTRHELVGSHSDQTLALEVAATVADRRFVNTIRERTITRVLRIAEE